MKRLWFLRRHNKLTFIVFPFFLLTSNGALCILLLGRNTNQHTMKKSIMITGVSASGKTTLEKALRATGAFSSYYNYTTRKPRSYEELDDYVFLTKEQFKTKLANGDFAEHTLYNDNYYAIGRFLSPEEAYVFVLEPGGLRVMEKWMKDNGREFIKLYIEVDEETVIKRLAKRGHDEDFIKQRLNDFNIFSPDDDSIVLDGRLDTDVLVEQVILLTHT